MRANASPATPWPGPTTRNVIPSGFARTASTASVCGCRSEATAITFDFDLLVACAMAIASAAAVASSSREALAIAIPVISPIIVWKFSSASSRPWAISA